MSLLLLGITHSVHMATQAVEVWGRQAGRQAWLVLLHFNKVRHPRWHVRCDYVTIDGSCSSVAPHKPIICRFTGCSSEPTCTHRACVCAPRDWTARTTHACVYASSWSTLRAFATLWLHSRWRYHVPASPILILLWSVVTSCMHTSHTPRTNTTLATCTCENIHGCTYVYLYVCMYTSYFYTARTCVSVVRVNNVGLCVFCLYIFCLCLLLLHLLSLYLLSLSCVFLSFIFISSVFVFCFYIFYLYIFYLHLLLLYLLSSAFISAIFISSVFVFCFYIFYLYIFYLHLLLLYLLSSAFISSILISSIFIFCFYICYLHIFCLCLLLLYLLSPVLSSAIISNVIFCLYILCLQLPHLVCTSSFFFQSFAAATIFIAVRIWEPKPYDVWSVFACVCIYIYMYIYIRYIRTKAVRMECLCVYIYAYIQYMCIFTYNTDMHKDLQMYAYIYSHFCT